MRQPEHATVPNRLGAVLADAPAERLCITRCSAARMVASNADTPRRSRGDAECRSASSTRSAVTSSICTDAQVGTVIEQMGRKRVAQRVRRGSLLTVAFFA